MLICFGGVDWVMWYEKLVHLFSFVDLFGLKFSQLGTPTPILKCIL